MVSLAELVRETMELYYEYFRATPEFNDVYKRLTSIQVSMPENIQRLVFLKGFRFAAYVCFKNVYWNESLFTGDFQHNNDQNRRILYTATGVDAINQQWNIYYNHSRQGYLIKSLLYDEYLYNPEDDIVFDDENRFIFTKEKRTDPLKGYWAIIPVDHNHFAIKNIMDHEYIYASKDERFYQVHHMRRVFSMRVKDNQPPQYRSDHWILEEC